MSVQLADALDRIVPESAGYASGLPFWQTFSSLSEDILYLGSGKFYVNTQENERYIGNIEALFGFFPTFMYVGFAFAFESVGGVIGYLSVLMLLMALASTRVLNEIEIERMPAAGSMEE